MGKVFSIVKEIDIDKLDDEIEKYMCITDNKDPYIFMNDNTAEQVRLTCNVFKYGNVRKNQIELYKGNQIFINNKLEFGEVEIR